MAPKYWRSCLLLLLCLLGFGCSSSDDVPDLPRPPSRLVAVNQVHEILSLYTYKVKQPKVIGTLLTWDYQVHDPTMRWVDRKLELTTIETITPPTRSTNGYELEILTPDGATSFEVETREQALWLYADLRYLAETGLD